MNKLSICVVVFSFLEAAAGTFPFTKSASVDWDGLRVTFNLNPFSKWSFASTGRTIQEAVKIGFEQKENFCEQNNPRFLGIRYWMNKDPAVMLLFDVNGFIAGIQTATPKSALPNPSEQNKNHPYVDDAEYWTLTAYFVDPSTICKKGRSEIEFELQGTGYKLFLQNGSNPLTDNIEPPLHESDISSTLWTKEKCFYAMGVHYFYNMRLDMSCDEFFPFFLLYNKGKLNAFGFKVNVNLPSPRYEHPTPLISKIFMNPVPKCFFTEPSFAVMSNIHVYLVDAPRTTLFC